MSRSVSDPVARARITAHGRSHGQQYSTDPSAYDRVWYIFRLSFKAEPSSLQVIRPCVHHCHYSIMSTTTSTLPYPISSGSAFSAFDKLQGIKNHANWKTNMRTVLLSLRQWGMVDGTIVRPVPLDKDNITPDEVAAIEA